MILRLALTQKSNYKDDSSYFVLFVCFRAFCGSFFCSIRTIHETHEVTRITHVEM